jgi:hypothetical protein
MSNININMLRIIADRWRKASTPGSTVDMNKLADDTLKMIDSEPLIKEVCQAFLYSVSIQAIKDQNFEFDVNDIASKNAKI